MTCSLVTLGLAGVAALTPPQDPAGTLEERRAAALAQLVDTLEQGGLTLDLEAGYLALPARILITGDLLEYVLVRGNGQAHESLLLTDADATLINAGMLALGLEPGTNALWTEVVPRPTEEELRAGAKVYDVTPPTGDGFYPHLAWCEGEETYFFRLEDVISNFATGRSMRRHRWVYLGSKFVRFDSGEEVFTAAQYGNLINISFFSEGHTLVTAALESCIEQTIWAANPWLLPPEGSRVRLILAREPLAVPPADLELPDVQEPEREPDDGAADTGEDRDG